MGKNASVFARGLLQSKALVFLKYIATLMVVY
nr:MAG TPA: hypothetical protein [Caudoviricetes sp.]